MEVILARTDCLRRQGGAAAERLRATFKAAVELLRSYFPDYVDRSFRWRNGCHAVQLQRLFSACNRGRLLRLNEPAVCWPLPCSPFRLLPSLPFPCRLTAYWAECEATVCDDLPAARAVWEAAIKVGRRSRDCSEVFVCSGFRAIALMETCAANPGTPTATSNA